MRKPFLLILILIVILFVAILLTLMRGMSFGFNFPGTSDAPSGSSPKNGETFTDFNTSVVPVQTFEIKTSNTAQGSVKTTDVRKLPEVVDVGDGAYSLEGTRSDKNAGFSLMYYAADDSYAIAILNEPIAANRTAASKYLLELLQVSETDACKLNVYIGTTYDVNPNLSGKNFGLSYCPGAVQL